VLWTAQLGVDNANAVGMGLPGAPAGARLHLDDELAHVCPQWEAPQLR
jgi:hypothetical protein